MSHPSFASRETSLPDSPPPAPSAESRPVETREDEPAWGAAQAAPAVLRELFDGFTDDGKSELSPAISLAGLSPGPAGEAELEARGAARKTAIADRLAEKAAEVAVLGMPSSAPPSTATPEDRVTAAFATERGELESAHTTARDELVQGFAERRAKLDAGATQELAGHLGHETKGRAELGEVHGEIEGSLTTQRDVIQVVSGVEQRVFEAAAAEPVRGVEENGSADMLEEGARQRAREIRVRARLDARNAREEGQQLAAQARRAAQRQLGQLDVGDLGRLPAILAHGAERAAYATERAEDRARALIDMAEKSAANLEKQAARDAVATRQKDALDTSIIKDERDLGVASLGRQAHKTRGLMRAAASRARLDMQATQEEASGSMLEARRDLGAQLRRRVERERQQLDEEQARALRELEREHEERLRALDRKEKDLRKQLSGKRTRGAAEGSLEEKLNEIDATSVTAESEEKDLLAGAVRRGDTRVKAGIAEMKKLGDDAARRVDAAVAAGKEKLSARGQAARLEAGGIAAGGLTRQRDGAKQWTGVLEDISAQVDRRHDHEYQEKIGRNGDLYGDEAEEARAKLRSLADRPMGIFDHWAHDAADDARETLAQPSLDSGRQADEVLDSALSLPGSARELMMREMDDATFERFLDKLGAERRADLRALYDATHDPRRKASLLREIQHGRTDRRMDQREGQHLESDPARLPDDVRDRLRLHRGVDAKIDRMLERDDLSEEDVEKMWHHLDSWRTAQLKRSR